jgi:hypothetical protein
MTTNSDLAAEGRATALENPNMSPPRLNRAEAWRKHLRPITEVFKSASLMIQSSPTSKLRWKFQLHIKATFFGDGHQYLNGDAVPQRWKHQEK